MSKAKYIGSTSTLDWEIAIVKVNDEPTVMAFGSYFGGSGWGNLSGQEAVDFIKRFAVTQDRNDLREEIVNRPQ